MHLAKFQGLELDPSKISESTTVKLSVLEENIKAFSPKFTESTDTLPKILLPRIEAIHEGRTRNFNRYLAEKLKGDAGMQSGVYSWLHPYPKPVIYNHDIESAATGRIYNAAFSEYTKAGRKGIIVIPRITDPAAIEKVLDGRLLTVSIGATTDSAVCSVCGTDIIAEGWCGHEKGEVIKDQTVEWIAGNLFFNELSWVNEPADQDAQVIDTGPTFAESYGGAFIDLSKKRTEWVLTQELAIAEGLVPKQDKEGEIALKTIEELKAEVDQLTSDLQRVTTEKTELEGQLGTVTTNLETAQNDLQVKTGELDAKVAELADATAAKATLEGQIGTLTQQVESLESDRNGLMETNTQLAADVHKSIAERVVDLKTIMGKSTITREEAFTSHVTRSTESLKDSLTDLLDESITFTAPRVVDKLTNPATGTAKGAEPNATIEGKDNTAGAGTPKELTKEIVLTRLFGGRTDKN